jgi:hypothetical protein
MRGVLPLVLGCAISSLACGGRAEPAPAQPVAVAQPEFSIACTVFPPVADEIADCARREVNGELALRPGIVGDTANGDPGGVLIAGELYFALPSGRTAPAFAFDNGLDYFVEGLARSVSDGKFGFVDQKLELVIPRTWDFAFPFENGVARVCQGCTISDDGEHGEVTGGTWSTIDRAGRIVEPEETAQVPG